MIEASGPLGDLIHRLRLPLNEVIEAERGWKRSAETMLQQGELTSVKEKEFRSYKDFRDRYLSVLRYCDDARELLDYHKFQSADGDFTDKTIFTIDPHLLTAYSDPWNPNGHNGFYFLEREMEELTDAEKRQFPVLTYSSVFNMGNVAILNSGRSEISRILAYFERTFVEDGHHASDAQSAMLDTLKSLHSSFVGSHEEYSNHSDFLQLAFERLTQIGGGPLLRQRLRLARLIQLMKKVNFSSSDFAVRNMLGSEVSIRENLTDFHVLMRTIRDQPSLLNEVRSQFLESYRQFIFATELFPGNSSRHFDEAHLLREGERDDLNALLEIHVLNTCLEVTKVPARFAYVTLSIRMYNFVRRYDKKTLRAPLLHPRTAIMMHDSQMFREHHANLARVLTAAIASGENVPNAERIDKDALSEFESTFAKPMGAIRNTFLHSIADTNSERQQLIKAFQVALDLTNLDVDNKRMADETLAVISSKLEGQVKEVGERYSKSSDKLGNDAWDAYEKFAKPEAQGKRLLIRISKNGSVQRFACLPIDGGYRHMFMLHSQLLKFDDIAANHFQTESVKTFLDRAGDDAQKSASDQRSETHQTEAQALKFFAQAVFAASDREWALAEVKATKAHDLLGVPLRGLGARNLQSLDLKETGSTDWNTARTSQFDQEILFMRHICSRASAEASVLPSRRLRWLASAADDLHDSARYTIDIPRAATGITTPYDPVSVRQALALISLNIEWLIGSGVTNTKSHMLGLPQTDRKDIAWAGINSLCFTDSAAKSSELAVAINEIIRRTSQVLEAIKVPDKGLHSEELWRFLLLRAHTIRLLLNVCADIGFLEGFEGTLTKSEFKEVEALRQAHESWVLGRWKQDPQQEQFYKSTRGMNPFLGALLAATSMRLNAEKMSDGNWSVHNASDLFAAFAQLDTDCNALDPFGFARRVVRAVKNKYAPALSRQLRMEYNS